MSLRLTAVAVLSLASCVAVAQVQASLSLDDAFQRVAQTHPELRLLGPRQQVLFAEQERAAQRPPLLVSVELENVLGTGETRGFRGADLTLSLASVFERGGKLEARRILAESRIDALAVERESRRLDLLAETARRYLAMLAAREQQAIAQQDVTQRQQTVEAARRRFQAGASPESVMLTAQAAQARAELAEARAVQQHDAARQHLAALWGDRDPRFGLPPAALLALPAIDDLAALESLLADTPELQQFADLARVREARLQLARSEASVDVDWSLGLRRLQSAGDVALVASLSMPLGTRSRAQPGIRAAAAELASLEIEQEALDMALYSTLVEAHGRYRVAQLEVDRLREDVLPRLERAESAAAKAYRAGATTYMEWAQLIADSMAVRRQQLEVALDAHRALIEIQRLTGQAFIAMPTIAAEEQAR